MLIAFAAVLALIVIAAVWALRMYNSLVRTSVLTEEGWSGIAVQLKRRGDLVGNLVESVKGYMSHEKEILEEVTRLRSAAVKAGETGAVAEAAAAERQLSQSIGRLTLAIEQYPQLKANENVMQLQQQLSSLEDEIQMSRRYYNGTARNYNILVQSFPSSVLAGMFGFAKKAFFELDNPQDAAVPKVKL